MKPIYKPLKLYKSDINDMVQDDLEKGGQGSGQKGHRTPLTEEQRKKKSAEADATWKRNKLKATNQISQARVNAMEKLKHQSKNRSPADEGIAAAKEEFRKKN